MTASESFTSQTCAWLPEANKTDQFVQFAIARTTSHFNSLKLKLALMIQFLYSKVPVKKMR